MDIYVVQMHVCLHVRSVYHFVLCKLSDSHVSSLHPREYYT